MSLLRQEDRDALKQEFSTLTQPVKLLLFTQELSCEYCTQTKQVLDELAQLSDKIIVKEISFVLDKETVQKFGVDKVPAVVVTDENESQSGVRLFGIPSGYEFMSLLGAVMDAGTGKLGLSEETVEAVKAIDKQLHLQVFVTPTCPYCPAAVRVAHQMARINPNIKADMVEAIEFPELAQRYHVMGVPRVVINEHHHFEGALPEKRYLGKVLEALNAGNPSQSTISA